METADTVLDRFLSHIEEDKDIDPILDYLQTHIRINYGYEGVIVFSNHFHDGKIDIPKDDLLQEIINAQESRPSLNHG